MTFFTVSYGMFSTNVEVKSNLWLNFVVVEKNRFFNFVIFPSNEAVTFKSRSRSIKMAHDNILIPRHLLVKFGDKTRKKWCEERK